MQSAEIVLRVVHQAQFFACAGCLRQHVGQGRPVFPEQAKDDITTPLRHNESLRIELNIGRIRDRIAQQFIKCIRCLVRELHQSIRAAVDAPQLREHALHHAERLHEPGIVTVTTVEATHDLL